MLNIDVNAHFIQLQHVFWDKKFFTRENLNRCMLTHSLLFVTRFLVAKFSLWFKNIVQSARDALIKPMFSRRIYGPSSNHADNICRHVR